MGTTIERELNAEAESRTSAKTLWRDAKTGDRLAIVDFVAYIVLGFFTGLAASVALGSVVLLLSQNVESIDEKPQASISYGAEGLIATPDNSIQGDK